MIGGYKVTVDNDDDDDDEDDEDDEDEDNETVMNRATLLDARAEQRDLSVTSDTPLLMQIVESPQVIRRLCRDTGFNMFERESRYCVEHVAKLLQTSAKGDERAVVAQRALDRRNVDVDRRS